MADVFSHTLKKKYYQKMFVSGEGRPTHKAVNLTAIYESID
jgi:hypothetical protein